MRWDLVMNIGSCVVAAGAAVVSGIALAKAPKAEKAEKPAAEKKAKD